MGFFRRVKDEKISKVKGKVGKRSDAKIKNNIQIPTQEQEVEVIILNDELDNETTVDEEKAQDLIDENTQDLIEDWCDDTFKRHEESVVIQNGQDVAIKDNQKEVRKKDVVSADKHIDSNTINADKFIVQDYLQSDVKSEFGSSVNIAERNKANVSFVVSEKGNAKNDNIEKNGGFFDKVLQDKKKVAFLPIYYDVFNLDGKTYGKLVRCYIDNSNKIVGFADGVEDFETENINVAGYIFADKGLNKILSDRYLNVKMANLNAYLGYLRTKGKANKNDAIYSRVRNHFIKISNEYLKREAKEFNYAELNTFNIDFSSVMNSKDSEILDNIMEMKMKYKQYNIDKKNGKNVRLNSGKIGVNKSANTSSKELDSGKSEETYTNYMPLFCVMEEDYTLSTVSIHCEWLKNGNVNFFQGFEITKGFDIDKIGNIYENKSLDFQLNECDYIVSRLNNVNNAYKFMRDAMMEMEKKERAEKAIYKCEDLVNGESFGNLASEKSKKKYREECECEKIEFTDDNAKSGKKEQSSEEREIEKLLDSGKIEVAVNVGAKVYGAIAETKKAFYLIAKKFLDADTSFESEKDNLNATLITNQIPHIPMNEVCKNILEFRDRIDFITDDVKGVKIPRQKRKKGSRCKNACKVIDFNTINKEDIKII